MTESARVLSSAVRGRLAAVSAPGSGKNDSLESGAGQIVTGDCLAVLPKFSSATVDFVLTDPPYLANYRDRDGRTISNDDNAEWLDPAFVEIFRVLKPNSFCVSFYGWPKVDRFLPLGGVQAFTPLDI